MADLTGRSASNTAHFTFNCPAPDRPGNMTALRSLLAREHVATVLDAALKWPGAMDNPCLRLTMSQAPWAVAVYDGRDLSTVYVPLGRAPRRAARGAAGAEPVPDAPALDL